MRTILALTLLILATSSCGPENKKVTDEQVDTAAQEETLDTIGKPQQDGVDTNEDDTTDRALPTKL